jgi:hypothetical protein
VLTRPFPRSLNRRDGLTFDACNVFKVFLFLNDCGYCLFYSDGNKSLSPFAPEAGRLLFAIRGEAGIATSLSGTSCGILAMPRFLCGNLLITVTVNTRGREATGGASLQEAACERRVG